MKVRDVIYVVAMVQAKKALSDVQLITKEKMELTEEYIQTFFDELVVGATIEAYDDRISVIRVNDEWHNCLALLSENINSGWWVYFADNLNLEGRIHFFRWYSNKEIAEYMCETITAMGLFNEILMFEVR